MAWRVARSLNKLLAQLNAMYPHRSKVSDGSIGDAAHASRSSDHNPWYGPGIVTARDFTHDPTGGIDCHKLASWLVASGDRRIKYIIWNRRIWQNGWQPYYGPNGHTHHLHLSVVASPACDDETAWKLGNTPTTPKESEVELTDRWDEKAINAKPGTVGHALLNMKQNIAATRKLVTAQGAAITALSQLVAKQTQGLSAAQVEAAVMKAIANSVVEVDLNVNGNVQGG